MGALNFTKTSIILAVSVILLAPLGHINEARAAVPDKMVVEGVLSASGGGVAADGAYDVTFSLYNVQSGGTAVWDEGPLTVVVKNGQFVHTLGKIKGLSADILDKLSTAWLGLKIGQDPELARQPLQSVAYALLAQSAKPLACSGCVTAESIAKATISADKVGFTFAGSKTKGGPADVALDVQCTGCVSVKELLIDADLDLGGNALKAKAISAASVVANTFAGDGSKLTGITIPSGSCKVKGEVVKGINPDGTLACVAALDPAALPPDGIDEISNNLIHNQFQNTDCMAKAVPLDDNNPIGVGAELIFGDYGLSQKLDVQIDVANSDTSSVIIKLWDPNNVEYLLWDKTAPGKTISGTWPSKDKMLMGDLTTWVNKNPKGKWRIQVIDGKFLNNAKDGAINKFCVSIQTLSSKKVQVKGDLIVDGNITSPGGLSVDGGASLTGGLKLGNTATKCDASSKGTLRYNPGPGLEVCNGTYWHVAKSRPVMWSGGCSSHGQGGGWNRYCTNSTEWNTADDYLTMNVGGSGIFQVKIPGYYRINMWAISHVCNWAHVRILVNGTPRHTGHEHSQNTWTDNFMDLYWPMNPDDKFEIQFYNSGCSNYAYHSWNSQGAHSRLQVEYMGPLNK